MSHIPGRVPYLSHAQLATLEAQVGANTLVNQTTTELQAAFQLGVQHVLRELRKGFVEPK